MLPSSGRLRGKEAAGRGNSTANKKPTTTAHCRTHPTLRSSQGRECQYGNLQLPTRDHRHRYKDASRHTGLQSNERRKMKRDRRAAPTRIVRSVLENK